MAKDSLRGRVIGRWEEEGRPQWDYHETKVKCLEENDRLRREGRNPAPCFREAIERKDEGYIKRWVMGCHFPWLPPREQKENKEQRTTAATGPESKRISPGIPSHVTLTVTDIFCLFGSVPDDILQMLRRAIEAVPISCFFDADGGPLTEEVKDLDRFVSEHLGRTGRRVEKNHCPFSNADFHFDIAIRDLGLLVEIEKGKAPRLELDILKIASACIQLHDTWKYGLLIVPSTHVKLPLAGRQSPVQYLQRLLPLIKPVIEGTAVLGIGVLGYEDPR